MNILTFDIEEWFTYKQLPRNEEKIYIPRLNNLLLEVLDLLDQQNMKATFFCLGAIARQHPEVLKAISARGHQIACHSDKHTWLIEFTVEQFANDTKLAMDSIENVIGHKVTAYRAPAFSITKTNKWAFDILLENGIEVDCSIFPATRDFGGFPGFEQKVPTRINYNNSIIKEFPIGTVSLFGKDIAYSGGGYFRLTPYTLLKRLMGNHDYVMTYFHMKDFDKEQNRKFNLRYFKNYYGINGAFSKFEKLLTEFEFINLAQADKLIDWNNTPIVKI